MDRIVHIIKSPEHAKEILQGIKKAMLYNDLPAPAAIPYGGQGIDGMSGETQKDASQLTPPDREKVRTVVQSLVSVVGDNYLYELIASISKSKKSTGNWATDGTGIYYKAPQIINGGLPPGLYACDNLSNVGTVVVSKPINTDSLIKLPDTKIDYLVEEFRKFWTLKEKYHSNGFLHKRGFLLYGPPGSGKTCAVQLMCQEIINSMGGLVLLGDRVGLLADAIGLLRKVEPNRPLLVLLEDIENVIAHGKDVEAEAKLLSVLDGELQTDSVVFVATTNQPHLLHDKFKNRPSRFDIVERINWPTVAARQVFIEAKYPGLDKEKAVKLAEKTEGFSLAHLRELLVSVLCFDKDEDTVIKSLREMIKRNFKEDDSEEENPLKKKDTGSVGFGRG